MDLQTTEGSFSGCGRPLLSIHGRVEKSLRGQAKRRVGPAGHRPDLRERPRIMVDEVVFPRAPILVCAIRIRRYAIPDVQTFGIDGCEPCLEWVLRKVM